MTNWMNLKRRLKSIPLLALLFVAGALAAEPATPASADAASVASSATPVPSNAPSAASAAAPAAISAPDAAPPALPSAFADPDDVPMPDPDLWYRIRVGFALDPLDSPLVADAEEWYTSRPDYIKRFVDRGSLYLHYIVEQVEKRGMPMEIALLPVVESAFAPNARSRSKASGLWQFIPSTGKHFGLTQNWWRDNRRDIVAATDAALNYLQRLHDTFGSWELALAAYNCGEGCVSRAIAYNQSRGLPTDYLSLTKLPPETRNYVPKLIAVKNIVLSPATYGIELESVPDQPYFTTVPAPPRIDVKVAAKLAGMSEEEFTALNPALNKPVAVAAKAGTLVLPLDKAEAFKANLESLRQAAGELDHVRRAPGGVAGRDRAPPRHDDGAVARGQRFRPPRPPRAAALGGSRAGADQRAGGLSQARGDGIGPHRFDRNSPARRGGVIPRRELVHGARRRHALRHRAALRYRAGRAAQPQPTFGEQPHPPGPQAAAALIRLAGTLDASPREPP